MLYDKRWDEAKPLVTDEPWRDVLRRAADLVEQRGLAKNITCAADGSLCIRGALTVAAGRTARIPFWGDGPRHDVSAAADCAMLNYLRSDVVAWNNAPERTKDEVVAALRAAAEIDAS